MDNRSRSRLLQLLLAKSFLDIVLVSALAVGFFFKAFPPYFHGWGEATEDSISGWVINRYDSEQRVEVQLFIDERFVGSVTADQPRPDIVTAGKIKEGNHGYVFRLPRLSQGLHTAVVYALTSSSDGRRRSLQQVGDPIGFEIDANGRARPDIRLEIVSK